MSEDLTQKLQEAEAKRNEAEAKQAELQSKVDELAEKLNKIPNNPDHFNQLKAERDEAKKKLKEIEDAQIAAKGEFETLANERLEKIKHLEEDNAKLKAKADEFDAYEENRRQYLLSKLDDEGKELYKDTPLKKLEKVVERETKVKASASSSNHKPNQQNDKPLIEYTTMN